MLSNRKKFFTIHKKTGWVVKILAGYLAGIILIFAAGASLIRPVSVIAAFSPNLDSSSETVSEEEESSALPSSELSPEAESSDEKAAVNYKETVNYKKIEIKSETEVVSKGSETAKKEDALYPGHGEKPGGGNDTGTDPVDPDKPDSSAASESSSASSNTASESSSSSGSFSEPVSSQESSDANAVVREAVYGLDVSYYQGDIDWNAVKKSGIEFVFIRVGYRGYGTGKLCLDNKFYSYIKGAKAAGLKVGVYFFSQAVTENEAREEAAFVLQHLEGYSLDFPVAYDMENWEPDYRTYNLSKSQITQNAVAFCEVVKAAGYTPMVYYGMGNYQKFDTALLSSRYKIWFAHYTTQTSYTGRYDIWQYTAKAQCPGIKGYVDKNVMYRNKTGKE